MSVFTAYLHNNAQTPLDRFVVYMLYKQVCNKHGEKLNRRSLSLSVCNTSIDRRRCDNLQSSSRTRLIAVTDHSGDFFSNSTAVHTKNGSREQNHALFRGDLSSLWPGLILSPFCTKFESSSFSHS